MPNSLKTGIITLIYKGGSKGTAKSYQPVTLMFHIIRVCERVITSDMIEYLEKARLLNDGQHGKEDGTRVYYLQLAINNYLNSLKA